MSNAATEPLSVANVRVPPPRNKKPIAMPMAMCAPWDKPGGAAAAGRRLRRRLRRRALLPRAAAIRAAARVQAEAESA